MNERQRKALYRLSLNDDWKAVDELLKSICYYDKDIYCESPTEMAYKVGARSVYIKIQQIIKGVKDGR